MIERRMHWRGLGAALAVVLVVVSGGCGGREYDALLGKRLDQLRAGAPFRGLFGPTELPDSPVKLRVPLVFKTSYVEGSKHPDDGGPIKPDRLQPPFLPLPGFKMCFESTATANAGEKVPFYCYLATLPAKDGDAAKLCTELQEKLQATFKDVPTEWDTIDAQTPEDKAIPWKRLRVVGEQPFYVTTSNNEKSSAKLPGVFEIWVHDAHSQIVIVAWRAPESIDTPGGAAPAKVSSGGLTIMQAPANAKPDLKAMPPLTAGTLVIEAPDANQPAG
jgi:hypothetical protein